MLIEWSKKSQTSLEEERRKLDALRRKQVIILLSLSPDLPQSQDIDFMMKTEQKNMELQKVRD